MSYGGDPRFLLPTKTIVSPPTIDSTPVLVKPQDPSGYGYAHGPSGPKPAQVIEPKIVQPSSSTESPDNGSIALGNGLISLSEQQIADKNARVGATNDLISFFNEQVGLRNQDIRQQNQLIEQQNINAKANYAIDTLGSNDNRPFSAKEFFSTELTGLSSGLSKGFGSVSDVKLGFGASVPIPGKFISESAISFGSSLFQGGKQLVAIAPVIGGEYYKLLTTGKSDYNIPKEGVTSVGSGFVESIVNPSAGLSKDSQAAYASNLAKIDTFIGSIRSTAKNQGLDIPHGQTSYSTAGGAVGTIGAIALSAYGLKDVAGIVPLRIVERPVLMQASQNLVFTSLGRDVTAKPTLPQYKGLALGYGGKGSFELLGKTPSGYVAGKPTFAKVAPEGYRVVVKDSVGQEVSNIGNEYSIFHGTNPKMYEYLASTGRTVQPNAGAIMEALNTLDVSGMKVASRPPAREISAGATSSPVVNKALMGGIISRQNFLNNLRIFSGGRAKEVYGSNVSAATLSERGLDVMNRLFPSQDVDIAKLGKGSPKPSNPISSFIEKQRPELTRTLHKGILKEQGLITDESSGLHGTDIISAQNIKKSGVTLSARTGPTEGFFVGSENTLPEGYAVRASVRTGNKAVLVKIGLAKNKILSFDKLSKGQRQQITTKDWITNQLRLENFAKSRGKSGATKPYDLAQGIKTNKNTRYEKIIYSPDVITSADIIPDYQLTTLQGVKIGTSGKTLGGVKVAEEGKIAEIPSHLEEPQGSSLKRGGRIFSNKIEQKTIKYNVAGLNKKIVGATENFQYQTQLKKIGTLQSQESIAQQGGTIPEQSAIIGNKLFIGEATHSGGKALVRGLEHAYDKADILMKNPTTYSEGVKLKEAADLLKSSQSDFFKINYNKTASAVRQSKQYNVSSGGPSSYPSGLSTVSILKSGRSFYSSLVKPKSGLSGKSGKSGKSTYSALSSQSNISGFSGKSGLSGFSGLSGLSGSIGKPGPSGYPGPSGKPGPSGYPGPSGSYVPPIPPGFPGGGGGKKYPNPQFGKLNIRLKSKNKGGPTRTYLHEVNNIFASSLSIKRIR